jgi:hypothetical protein
VDSPNASPNEDESWFRRVARHIMSGRQPFPYWIVEELSVNRTEFRKAPLIFREGSASKCSHHHQHICESGRNEDALEGDIQWVSKKIGHFS